MLPILLACSLAAPPDFEALPADAISRIGSPKLTRPVRSAESAHLTADGRYAIFVASNPGRGRTQTRPPETPAEWWDLRAGKRIVPPFDLPNDCRIVRAVPAGIVTDQRGSYQLRNPATGAVQFEISPPRERGRSYFNVPNFSPDGKTAVAFVNEVITVYRLQPDGKVIGTPTPVKSPGPWAASHRGGVIVWLDDEEIKRLDLGSGEIRVVQKLEEPLNILLSLTVSPDGNAIVAVLRDRNGDHQPEIRMYPGRLPAVTFKPSSRKSYLSRVEFTTDGRELFSIYGDHTIIWSAETREILHEFTTPSYGNTLLTPDASRLLFIDQRGTIRVFDPRTQNELTPPVTRLPDLEFVSWRDENTLIASGLSNATAGDESKMRGAVIHWKADSSTVLSNIPITAKETARITHFHPGGTLAVAQIVGSTAPILIDPSTGKLVRDFPNPKEDDFLGPFSPDGRRMLACIGGRPGLYSADGSKCLVDFPIETARESRRNSLTTSALSPDGRLLVQAAESNQIVIYEVATGRRRFAVTLSNPDQYRQYQFQLAFSRNGQKILAALGSRVALIDPTTGLILRSLDHLGTLDRFGQPPRLALSRTGRWAASADPRTQDIAIHDLEMPNADTKVHTFTGATGVISDVAFSPDDRKLVTVSIDGTAVVWDIGRIIDREVKRRSDDPSPRWWEALASFEVTTAGKAMSEMIGQSPDRAVALLAAKLQPPPGADPTRVNQWIQQLDDEQSARRDAAERELRAIVDQLEEPLREALKRATSAEPRRRLTGLIDLMEGPEKDADRLRAIRGIEVLERIGTPEAMAVLDRLARGPETARITREARAARTRLLGRSDR